MPLPIVPRPQRDEIVPSWLGRVGAYYNLDVPGLRKALPGRSASIANRVDVNLDLDETINLAAALRCPRERIEALDLKRVWPDLAVNWLPAIGGKFRAKGDLDVSWCRSCLQEAHGAGGAYLDRETALPLVLCHRHREWRYDCCRRCKPYHPPQYAYLSGTIELICSDCGRPLRYGGRGRGSPEPGADENLKSRFDLLFRFESQLRSAWLGHPVILDAAGTASAHITPP